MVKLKVRKEVPRELTWNAESVFLSVEAWEEEFSAVSKALSGLVAFKGNAVSDGKRFVEVLELCDSIRVRLGHLFVYAFTLYGVDTNDPVAARIDGKANGLSARFAAATAFLVPEILDAGEERILQLVSTTPELSVFEHYCRNLFRNKPHVRNAEVEELLGAVSDPFSAVETTYTVLSSGEIRYKDASDSSKVFHSVGQGTIGALLQSRDRTLRQTAWESFADGYLSFRGAIASNYLTAVKQDIFRSRARRYESTLEAALFPQQIPRSVFSSLLDTFQRNLPVWHRYWRVRKKLLGVDKLQPFDIWAPISRKQPVVSLQQAIDWISEGMAPLGTDYVAVLRQGCSEDRWLDTVCNNGKRAGAWSGGSLGTHPFIVMSYTDDLGSMSTLAHELGHSMHSYLTWKKQPPVYADYSIFAAEVASNFNQALVRDYLFELHAGDADFQVALIEEAMGNFHRYLFIMPTLARFEQRVHAHLETGQSMAAEDLNRLMHELFAEGYGSEVGGDPERIGITWAQFPHLYAPFYVFQYATGISAAHDFASRVRTDGAAAEKYLEFLQAGSSLYPVDALKRAGCDLTSSEPVDRAFATLGRYVDRLEGVV